MMTAKQILNEATFVAARAGAVQNAQVDAMRQTLYKALIPFYQNTLDGNATTRIANAWILAQQDLAQPLRPAISTSRCSTPARRRLPTSA